MKLQAALSAVPVISSFSLLRPPLLLLLSCRLDASRRPARKQMSDDHPVHSRHNGKRPRPLKSAPRTRQPHAVTTSYILDNLPTGFFKSARSIWLPIFGIMKIILSRSSTHCCSVIWTTLGRAVSGKVGRPKAFAFDTLFLVNNNLPRFGWKFHRQ